MNRRCVALGAAVWAFALVAADEPAKTSSEARALGYLAREVPRWSAENHCYSCHNNGDAARALYAAVKLGEAVPAASLADTSRWLARPESWDRNGGDGPFSDKRLARIQFTAALAAGVDAKQIVDRAPLLGAAKRLTKDQEPDGPWRLDDAGGLGTPATYGRALATALVLDALRLADAERFRSEIGKAEGWLRRLEPRSTPDASAVLLAAERKDGAEWAAARERAMGLLRKGMSEDGGWGPYTNAPPEPFDTAVAVIGLARQANRSETDRMMRLGRRFLIANQNDDGSWPETTRPAGAESYAQRLSTAGWATMALLATRRFAASP